MSKKPVDTVHIDISFPIQFSILIGIIAVVLVGCYLIFVKDVSKTLIFAAATAASTGAILAAFYTGRILVQSIEQDIYNREQLCDSIDFQRKVMALEYASKWNEPSMLKVRKACRKIVHLKEKGLNDVESFINSNGNIDDVIHLLNFLEEIAFASQENIADPRLLKEGFLGIVRMTWDTLGLWVKKRRNDIGDQGMWIELEALYSDWTSPTKK